MRNRCGFRGTERAGAKNRPDGLPDGRGVRRLQPLMAGSAESAVSGVPLGSADVTTGDDLPGRLVDKEEFAAVHPCQE